MADSGIHSRNQVALSVTTASSDSDASPTSPSFKSEKAIPRVVLGLPPLPILPNSDAAVSALETRSSSDVVHDKVFIPTIVSMGVLVIICIYCCYHLIVHRETVRTGAFNDLPVSSSQHAVGRQENGHGSRPLSRGLSKTTRGSAPSTLASMPGSPSVRSNMLENLQRRREEQHLREMQQQQQQQDPYEQYMSSNQGYPHPQQHYQYTPHPSVAGSAVRHEENAQPQLPHDAHVPIAQSPPTSHPSREQYWAPQERQNSQQPDPRRGIPHTPTTSDVLSYMTPPEDRHPPLPINSSRPQNYFSPPHSAATGSPLQSQRGSSTHGNIAHLPANYNPASRLPSTNSAHTARPHGYPNQPPEYTTTETRNDVQTPHSEKQR